MFIRNELYCREINYTPVEIIKVTKRMEGVRSTYVPHGGTKPTLKHFNKNNLHYVYELPRIRL